MSLSTKALGLGLLGIGLFLTVFFPATSKYQPEEMSKLGVGIGIVLIGIGIFLLYS